MASASAPRPMATPHPAQRWTIVLDGHRLRHLRIQNHLSQKQLAQLAGISQATVTRLEGQLRVTCRSRTLARLASALGEQPAALTPGGPG